jgi:Family of unknown function (DUF5767)
MEFKKDKPRRRKKMAGVSLREMEEVALNFDTPLDVGNVINIDGGGSSGFGSNDMLGLGMLSNSNKTVTVTADQTSWNTSSGGGGGIGLSEVEVTNLDDQPTINLNMGGNSAAPIDIDFKRAEADKSNFFSNNQTASGPSIALAPASQRDPVEEKKEKIEYLNKLQRLEQKGFPVSRRFTMDNALDEIKQEYMRLVDARNLETSLRFQRQALIGVVTGMEWLNGRFDPFDLKMDGWSESVHENVEDFDEIFEELYDKYKDRGKMPPELRLMTALAGSGFMCHVSNTFLKSRMPSADDVLRQNPDLARQFAAAAANQAGPGFGNFMGMAMGQTQGGPQGAQAQGSTGAFFQASQPRAPQAVASVEASQPSVKQTARREMKGPTGVDDILSAFQEARERELNEVPQTSAPQSAVAAAVEIQSMASDDIQSAVESTRTGRTGGGRRRRQAVGNTLSLSV